MGSSARKKKEKQKDFQKPKYKVGKAKPKASNFTDTSFKSKAIVVGQQSLSTVAPDVVRQFKHSLSLASSSKSDKQRQEALSYLTSQLSSDHPVNPVGTQTLLTKLLPLISDSSTPVRTQLLKLFQQLPDDQVRQSTDQIILYIRAGMTHLSADISNDALGFMDWLLDAAGEELVSCPGGWLKTLSTFCATMGWSTTAKKDGWSSSNGRAGLKGRAAQNQVRTLETFLKFLQAGFSAEETPLTSMERRWDGVYRIPRDPNAFAYLNLIGTRRDEDGEMYTDRESRQRVFHRRFFETIVKGVVQVKKDGGVTGRAASFLEQLLLEKNGGFGDYEMSVAMATDDLLELW